MTPKRRKQGPQKPESPLEAKKREIAEREAKTLEEIEKCKKLIQEAPQRAEKMAKAQRDELISRAARTETRRGNPVALHDYRRTFDANIPQPARHRSLRAERRQGRLLFFALLSVAVGLGYYVYYTITHL